MLPRSLASSTLELDFMVPRLLVSSILELSYDYLTPSRASPTLTYSSPFPLPKCEVQRPQITPRELPALM